MNVLIDNYNATCYLKQRGISNQFIYLIAGKDAENNLYYLVTGPGLARWQTNLDFVITNKGFWLSKEFAKDVLKEQKKIYQECFFVTGRAGCSDEIKIVSTEVVRARVDL